MRFAFTTFVVAMALFLGGATSLLGSWAVTAACPVFLVAAVAGAVAMEGRDLAMAEGLLPASQAADAIDVDPVLVDAA
jgi:hypothetical protein